MFDPKIKINYNAIKRIRQNRFVVCAVFFISIYERKNEINKMEKFKKYDGVNEKVFGRCV